MLILLLTYVETNMVKTELLQNNTINNIQSFYKIIETKLKKNDIKWDRTIQYTNVW